MPAWLFDLDGTLIDSKEDIAHSANAVREALGLPPRPLEEIYGFIGEGVQNLLARALGRPSPDELERALALWRAEYGRRMLDHTRVFDGLHAALDALGGTGAVVTNKPGAFARRIVEALSLSRWFP
ncbi:MAG: HAD family hydrolase, partial [Myxococcales bacterium]